jgi:signal peptidase II
VLFFAIAILGAAADLGSKEFMFRWLGAPWYTLAHGQPPAEGTAANTQWLWTDHFGFQTSLNQGALFGMGAGFSVTFAALSIAAGIGVFVWLFWYRAAHDRWLTVALGCVTAGILGNLYDRLGLYHIDGLKPEFANAVRDWILFQVPEVSWQILNPWPNFNIADSLLVIGACMLVWHSFRAPAPTDETSKPEPAKARMTKSE